MKISYGKKMNFFERGNSKSWKIATKSLPTPPVAICQISGGRKVLMDSY